MEIEKKYLIHSLPILKDFPCKQICQGYISTDPVIRVRKSDDQYFVTLKGDGQIAREEWELPITAEQYSRLLKKVEGQLVEKSRYLIPLDNGLTAELDIYKGDLEGFRTVEVEFPSLETIADFRPPSWFGRDVSEDKSFKNSQLSLFGIPREFNNFAD